MRTDCMSNSMATSAAPEPENPAASETPLAQRALSEELAELQRRSAVKALTFQETIAALGPQAYAILVILLSLPFTTPIPVPGLSTVFGIIIGHIALSFTLGREPWIPRRFQQRTLPAGFFGKVMRVAAWIIRFLEKRLRTRWVILVEHPALRRTHSLVMLLAAAALLLPLPIPFTNTFPAWAIILIAAGLLERDGVFIVGGYLVFIAGVFYFLFLGEAAQRFVSAAWEWITARW